ncbi:MAG: helix-turn-helix domain-containing protein [Pseudomonadota bacterium]
MTKRVRLTPEVARENILQAAEKCLINHGVDGLRMTAVAEEANIVHSSILHHFGSAEGLKQALGKRLSIKLFEEVAQALSSADQTDTVYSVVERIFDALGPSGHANLLAWLVIAGPKRDNHLTRINETYGHLFGDMTILVQQNLSRIRQQPVRKREARFVVYHVLIAACGHGILGDTLRPTLGMHEQRNAYVRWLCDRIEQRATLPGDSDQ